MVYRESELPKYWPAILALLILLCLVPVCGLLPLTPAEAIIATAASKIAESPSPAVAIVEGVPVTTYPLYPLIVRTLSVAVGGINVWSVRLPSVAAIVCMTLATLSIARRKASTISAVVAAVIVATAPLSFIAGTHGDGTTVAAGLIVMAWFSWYVRGRVERSWSMAWCAALVLVLLAALQIGFLAFITFYLPLFFVRRPIRAWRRMSAPSHLSFLAVMLALFFAWSSLIPSHPVWSVTALAAGVEGGRMAAHMPRGLWFILACIGLYMPWIMIAWPAYCAAFRTLETKGVFTGYLRTIILPVFIAALLLPSITPTMLVVLICPLAVLTGIHYPILVRRHHRGLWRLVKVLRFSVLLTGSLVIAVAVPVAVRFVISDSISPAFAIILLLAAVGVLSIVRLASTSPAARYIWLNIACSVAGIELLAALFWYPIQSHLSLGPVQGQQLAEQVPENAVVYKLTPEFIPVRSFYLDRQISFIASPAALPADAQVVYALGGNRPPILEDRTWAPCSERVDLNEQVLPELRWDQGKLHFALVRQTPQEPAAADRVLRMYRGVRRGTETRPGNSD